ncbi:MAG: reverse transcriptase domain-containing protein, partial [Candidatus Rickettsiella isopodorum]|nr:reverse transcriptase domain-containing protein [Candidatus Rickettsiella isopodorum]
RRMIALVRAFLNAGVMENGLFHRTDEGAPQGGPLSPLLSNIVLDELDKELEARGHKFVRYADDCNIYVKSERSGERVMNSIRNFIVNKLKLKVNESKSAVARPQERKFLGFSFTGGKVPNRRKIADQSLEKFKNKIRKITNRNYSISLESRIKALKNYINGWKAYFGFCETQSVLRDLDSWIRRRLRCVLWKQWKIYSKRKHELIKRGITAENAHAAAWSSKGPWNIAHTPVVRIALPNKFFDSIGLPRLCLA